MTKTKKTQTKKKKRVNFPWVKKKQGKVFKYYLAFFIDSLGWESVIKGKRKYKTHIEKKIIPELNKKFPSMYKRVKKYYKQHGRSLSRDEFKILILGRINAMFDFDKKEKKIVKKKEHPDLTSRKSKKSAGIARVMLKTGKGYLDVIDDG